MSENWSVFADGAPESSSKSAVPWERNPASAPEEGSTVERVINAATRIRSFEGWRGYSNRIVVAARQVGAFALLLLAYLATEWAFSGYDAWRHGGEMMLFSVATIQLSSALGTVMYAESRFKIIEQARQFTFGLVAFPAAGLAVFMRVVLSSVDVGSSSDVFTSMLIGNGLPLLFFSCVVIPAVVHLKYIFGGVRAASRAALADEEYIEQYSRYNGL